MVYEVIGTESTSAVASGELSAGRASLIGFTNKCKQLNFDNRDQNMEFDL